MRGTVVEKVDAINAVELCWEQLEAKIKLRHGRTRFVLRFKKADGSSCEDGIVLTMVLAQWVCDVRMRSQIEQHDASP